MKTSSCSCLTPRPARWTELSRIDRGRSFVRVSRILIPESVLQLNVGEHTITLSKTGYKPWQRKMKVVTGEINLNADLEPENPK